MSNERAWKMPGRASMLIMYPIMIGQAYNMFFFFLIEEHAFAFAEGCVACMLLWQTTELTNKPRRILS